MTSAFMDVSTIFILGKQRKVAEYYKKQERLLEGFSEMDTMAETGCFPGSLTEVDHPFTSLTFNLAKFLQRKPE